MALRKQKTTSRTKTKTATRSSAKTTASKKGQKTKITAEQLNEYIQTRAYYVWEEWGRPQGKEKEIWEQATKDIKAQYSA